jgi:CRP/FNR family cyclic AMP-dependent transcriptional regulator
MSAVDLLGYAASAAVLATFCMRTMIPLRIAGIISNVFFIAYGYFDHLPPVLLLHVVLLPVNLLRLVEFQRLVRAMGEAHSSDLSLKSLIPYMKNRKMAAGEMLVRKGEQADRLYYLADGELEVVEFNKVLKPGAVIGEIGIFARDQVRTATVVCRTDCKLLELTEKKARELYFEDRSFSFAVLQLIIQRLTENNERLQQSRSDAAAAAAVEA